MIDHRVMAEIISSLEKLVLNSLPEMLWLACADKNTRVQLSVDNCQLLIIIEGKRTCQLAHHTIL
jgi:hypothetical protein